MKTFSFAFSLVLFLFAATTATATPESGEDTQQLRREIARMIDAPQLEQIGLDETMAVVSFTINDDNEIVVQGVAAAKEEIVAHIKQELNGRALKYTDLEVGTLYSLKVQFKSAS